MVFMWSDWIDIEYTKAKAYFKEICNIQVTVKMGHKIVRFVNNHCTKPCCEIMMLS